MIARGRSHVPHPHGIAIFEDNIYYSDLTKMSIFKMSKYQEAEDKTALVTDTSKRIYTVKVIHPVLQQRSEFSILMFVFCVFVGSLFLLFSCIVRNPCENASCDQMCLTAHVDDSDTSYRCACQRGYRLAQNLTSCISKCVRDSSNQSLSAQFGSLAVSIHCSNLAIQGHSGSNVMLTLFSVYVCAEITEFLVFATSVGLRGIPVEPISELNEEAIVPVVDKKEMRANYVALDVDTDEGYMYYSEVRKDIIYRIRPDGSGIISEFFFPSRLET